MGIKKELTPNVLANNRREYRAFEVAFNKGWDSSRHFSHDDRKQSFPRVRRISRQKQKDRMVDVYTQSMPQLSFANANGRKAKSAHSLRTGGDRSRSRNNQKMNTQSLSRPRSLLNPFRRDGLSRPKRSRRHFSGGSGGAGSKLAKAIRGPSAHRDRSKAKINKAR